MKLLVVIAALFISSPALANIYKCKGPSGATVYREVPCATTESEVGHKIVAPDPGASPPRQRAPGKEKVESPAESRGGVAPTKSTTSAPAAGDVDARMCEGFRRRYEEAKRTACIQGVQEGTGKVMCMPEAQRTAFIANLKELVEQNCR